MSFCRRKTGLELLLQTFWLVIRESKTQTSTNQLWRYTRELESVYRIVRPYLQALPPHSWMLWASFFLSLIFSAPRYVMNEHKTVSSQCRTDMVGATWLSGAYKSMWFFYLPKEELTSITGKKKGDLAHSWILPRLAFADPVALGGCAICSGPSTDTDVLTLRALTFCRPHTCIYRGSKSTYALIYSSSPVDLPVPPGLAACSLREIGCKMHFVDFLV